MPFSLSGSGMGCALIEITLDKPDQGVDRLVGLFAFSAQMQHGSLRRLGGHHLDDTLGVEPWAFRRQGYLNLRRKALGELGELHRWAGMEADLVGDHHMGFCI